MIKSGNNYIKKMFDSPPPKQVKVLYTSKGYDLGIGKHDRFTCYGHEIDMILCDNRGPPYTIVARDPETNKRYMGFDYDLERGQCKFFDFGISEKEIRKLITGMDVMLENTW